MDEIRIETAGQSTYAPSWDAVVKLNTKIANLMHSIGPVQKDARNAHFKYEYTSYEAMAAAVRAALFNAGLSFTIGTGQVITEGPNRTVELEACFGDTETGAMRLVRWTGEGVDNQDKATAKAITSGVKYLFLRNLLISTNEDVDPDADGPATKAERETAAIKPEHDNGQYERPYDAEIAVNALRRAVERRMAKYPAETAPAREERTNMLAGTLNNLFTIRGAKQDVANIMRHSLLMELFGVNTTKGLSDAHCTVLAQWSCENVGGEWVPDGDTATEAARIVETHEAKQGQQKMEGV